MAKSTNITSHFLRYIVNKMIDQITVFLDLVLIIKIAFQGMGTSDSILEMRIHRWPVEPPQMVNNVAFLCSRTEQTVGKTVYLSVIWNVMTPMWRY